MTDERKLQWGLFSLRVGIAFIFLTWTIDKIFNYSHNSTMLSKYYFVEISQPILLAIGIAELILILVFLAGKFKNVTYALILIFHLVTTIASAKKLFPPYEIHQLLYFGAIPMLAACICLYLNRDADTLFTLKGSKD